MNILECFSGTGSVGKVAESLGWNVVSVDSVFPATHHGDIMDFDYKQYPKDYFQVIWGSPPCHTFSHLQYGWIGRQVRGELVTKESIMERQEKEGVPLLNKLLEIIEYFKPRFYFIENPATSRMKNYLTFPNYVVDYCMYCDWGYKKRTRFWTNVETFVPKTCNGKCGNILQIGDKKLHSSNLGNFKQKILIKKHTGRTGDVSRFDAYRIPPALIEDLFMCVIDEF